MFVAIDRTSKFAFVELHERATTAVSREFLLRLIAAVPYKIHTVLTDNGIQFTTPGAGGSAVPLIKEAIANGELFWAHAFELTCAKNDIDHRTTKAKHPWTNGQVERMNRTIKDATVRRYYYESHEQLRQHLANFVSAYNVGRRAQDAQGPHPLRVHLQSLGFPAPTLLYQSAPANPGTEHLALQYCRSSLAMFEEPFWIPPDEIELMPGALLVHGSKIPNRVCLRQLGKKFVEDCRLRDCTIDDLVSNN